MRRLPPQQIEKNLSDLIDLVSMANPPPLRFTKPLQVAPTCPGVNLSSFGLQNHRGLWPLRGQREVRPESTSVKHLLLGANSGTLAPPLLVSVGFETRRKRSETRLWLVINAGFFGVPQSIVANKPWFVS